MIDSPAGRLGLNTLPILSIIIAWELLASLAIINPAFFPPPTEIVVVAVDLIRHEDFLFHVATSLRRIVMGFAIGATTGLAVGLLIGWSRSVRLIVNPYLGFLYPIPKITLLPILFVFFGVSETSRVLTMSIAVFLLVAITTMGAVRQIEDVYIDIAIDNGAGTIDLYREVIIPGALPQVFSGLSLGFGLGFILIVVIEMVAADSGLGYVIWSSWRLFTIPRMYVAIVTINLLGILIIYGTEFVGESLTPWTEA